MPSLPLFKSSLRRRDALAAAFSAVGLSALSPEAIDAQEQRNRNAPVPAKDNLKITKLETILVKPRWLFLKIHTNAGIVGLGEPITEGRALTCAEAVKEIEPYLVGKDPRPVAKH
jgi:galactonate dehydratase